MELLSAITAGIALGVSVFVFLDNRRRAIDSARLARRPALVFTWDGAQRQWMLSNIGNGPALDLVILQRVDGAWTHPLRMPEMAAQDDAVVPRAWFERWHRDPGLGARYRSITGEQYMTSTADDWSQMMEGWADVPPSVWAEIEPHWRYRDGDS